jgi:XTP/dITP diphosphohydrolase
VTRLLVATRNRGKQSEFRELLAGLPLDVVFPDEVGLDESAAEGALEAFDTFEANARAKARWFASAAGLPALADDSGLEVDALGGAPGVHSRRFAGGTGPDHELAAANNAALLARLSAVGDARRRARYRCALVLAEPRTNGGVVETVVSGAVEGRILREAHGTNGFGYDPLFYCDELGMTFGDADGAAKHRVSHRGRAMIALIDAVRTGARHSPGLIRSFEGV